MNSNKGVSTRLWYVKQQQRLISVTPAASILGKRAKHKGLSLMISPAEEYVNFTPMVQKSAISIFCVAKGSQ